MNDGLFAFVFELVLLCARASLCASVAVDPFPPNSSQILPEWQRVGDLATAAAVAAAEEVCPSPSRETVQVVKIAARAATAATATALGGEPMQLSDVPWGASSCREQCMAGAAGADPRGLASTGDEQASAHGGRDGESAAGQCGRGEEQLRMTPSCLRRGEQTPWTALTTVRRPPATVNDRIFSLCLPSCSLFALVPAAKSPCGWGRE
ncbi:hypothetical protein I4F81_012287 [Pyropia yezoensis]|uniref:Uncharacterized protein n=1 Tax=Pyropia yezoensis TaxID=2788 RepID=A0ACC3CI15_PYRYE|nr:hypothetical protein I4F81_012287 [Neopyropia yezoensis]